MPYWWNLISHVCGDPAAANEPWKAAELLRFLEYELKDQPKKKKKFQLRAFSPRRHSCESFQEKEQGSGSQGSGSCCSMVQFSVAPFFSQVAADKSKHGRVKFHFYYLPSFYVFKEPSPLNFVSGLLSKWMALKNTSDLEKVPLKKNENNKQHICRVKFDTESLVSPHPIIGLSLKTLSGGINKWATIKGLDEGNDCCHSI